MPFTPVATLDPIKIAAAERTLCEVFRVPSLRAHQVTTGQYTLRGFSTFLDVPTGGGKTLAFWYPLFYYWAPGNLAPDCQKIILVVGPLTALIDSQAADLTGRGIPANLARNDYRVAFISPEMATSPKFQGTVLSSPSFANNIISLVIDEAHCISEWGNDDFRPEFSNLSVLIARIPSGVPVVAGSATMPKDVILDIQKKLTLRSDCKHVAVSNNKRNIVLSVRIIQHPQDTLADLMTLFTTDANGPEDFPQTLLYADERIQVERMQDFMRRNRPEGIPETAFEFYHRHIDEKRKKRIQEMIQAGTLLGTAATDALGMGMDFRHIMRVLVWLCPRSFLSLVQKLGRCGRAADVLGEGILYVTSAAYMQYVIELEILKGELPEEEGDEGPSEQPEVRADGEQMDRDAAVEEEEPEPVPKAPRRKVKKTMAPLEARDRRYLLEYITTKGCRRIPWNKFFGNDLKTELNYSIPEGARCCDNCDRPRIPVDTIQLTGGTQTKLGRPPGSKTTEEVAAAIKDTLVTLRNTIARTKYPDQNIITGKVLMSDVVVDALANRARTITSVEAITQTVHWAWAAKLGPEVVDAVQKRLLDFPDLARLAREEEQREKAFAALQVLAEKDLRNKLTLVFDGCHEAVTSEMVTREGRSKSVRRCQVFMTLPKRNFWPDYYERIQEPISIANIRKFSQTTVIRSATQLRDLQ
ncbi:P-loop containing nucleoside triphosphate hydrolase protein [Mycena filopes]|nr:P-loop containing nucleoside triphosphate hydrolase protein [Mycena filopes]